MAEGWEILQNEIREASYREANAIYEQNSLISNQNEILSRQASESSVRSDSSPLSFKEIIISIIVIATLLFLVAFGNTVGYLLNVFYVYASGNLQLDKKYLIFAAAVFAIVVLLLIKTVAFSVIFKKSGEVGLVAFVPLLNLYYLCKIADGNGWKALIFVLPVIRVFYYFYLNFRLADQFNRRAIFKAGLVVLNTLFLLFLAFGKKE